jgi:hypothetical protein
MVIGCLEVGAAWRDADVERADFTEGATGAP